MAIGKRNPWFSFESDNDEIDLEQDVTGTVTELDETAVDDAGEDSETTDVTPSKEETAHNEVASAGGVATGNNTDQLEMDPVAASEAWIRKTFGLSREDMEEAVDETIAKAETIPDASEANLTGDPDLDNTVVEVQEETSGGEIVDADNTGVDNPALAATDETVEVTGEPADGDSGDEDTNDEEVEIETEETMEAWLRSLEGDDGCDVGDENCDKSKTNDKTDEKDDDNESSEWWFN